VKKEYAAQLKDLLGTGWSVKGFHGTLTAEWDDGAAASKTDGYAILLQNGDDLAVAFAAYNDPEHGDFGLAVTNIHHLTGAK
jgi:hypothetical protein